MIFSSIQIIAKDHPYEKWSNFPLEKQRLFSLIDNHKNNVLLVSGDRHRGGLYQLTSTSGKNIVEMTSSSLNLSFTNDEEAGPLRVGPTFVQENYGEMLLDKMTSKLTVNLKDNQGNIIQSVDL